MVAVGEVLDSKPLLGQFADELLHGRGLVQFDQARPAAQRKLLFPGLLRGLRVAIAAALDLIVEKIEIAVFLVKRAHLRFAGKVGDPLGIALANLDEIGGQRAGLRITLAEIFFEVAAVPPDYVAELGKPLEQFEDVLEL